MSNFTVDLALKEVFPGRFKKVSPAACAVQAEELAEAQGEYESTGGPARV